MKKKFDYISIVRKILGIFWVEWTYIYRNFGDDDGELFRETRDKYVKKWGVNNVRFKVIWMSEHYDGNGKRLF